MSKLGFTSTIGIYGLPFGAYGDADLRPGAALPDLAILLLKNPNMK
jgi:hypothetical protein